MNFECVILCTKFKHITFSLFNKSFYEQKLISMEFNVQKIRLIVEAEVIKATDHLWNCSNV